MTWSIAPISTEGHSPTGEEIARHPIITRLLYWAAHNDFLAAQAMAVRTRLNAFRRMQLRQERRLASSRAEPDAVMRAIAEGNGEEAARRMRAHMLNAASALDSTSHIKTKALRQVRTSCQTKLPPEGP